MSHDKQKGFTLIELLLAMTFISMLLLAIALTIIQISAIYNRGMTLKEVNQSGRSLASEMTKSIESSIPFSVDQTLPGSHFITQGNWGGRLCADQYSYIWNYGSALAGGNTAPNLNVYSSGTTKIRFVKIYDVDASYCTTPSLAVNPSGATELLSTGDHDIVMHNLSITSKANDPKTGQKLYLVTFTIGTNDTASLLTGGTGCKAPNVSGADPTYCVVQTFSFVALAGNIVQ